MANYLIRTSKDLEEKDWDNKEKVLLDIYELGFPERLETSVPISISEAYDLIDQLQRTISEIEASDE